MDFNMFRDLYIDLFHEPKVGWYDRAKNLRGLEMARQQGIPFVNHLVESNDPYKVVDIHDRPRPGQYEKVQVPPRSQLTEGGRYRVAPKNIIPYSPNNKSLANMLMKKGLNAGARYLSRWSVPLAILQYQLNNPAY